ncbi:hypothetical protein D3C78_1314000 [compost metagenome]
MVSASMRSARRMRRTPDSDMPRQFLKLSLISFQVGMVVMVLSQFCTLTMLSAMSITKPSAPTWGISTQSPTRIMSFEPSCTPAVKDRMVSLNTSISTADIAPRPDSSSRGERSSSVATMSTAATMKTSSLVSCT